MAFRLSALRAPVLVWAFSVVIACSSDDKDPPTDSGLPALEDGAVPVDGSSDSDGAVLPPDDAGDVPLDPTGDADGDGRDNARDNCPRAGNIDQADIDGDGYGDACDNCKSIANLDQADTDNDGLGNVCEEAIFASGDDDGDGLVNILDKCMFVADMSNADADGDGVGDPCDNCPSVANRNQADADKDATGDACEEGGAGLLDMDLDGIPDANDNCPALTNAQADGDKDLIGDACDNCPTVANFTQADANKATPAGDACEDALSNPTADFDGDGVANGPTGTPPKSDNCRTVKNANQLDTDKDMIGDACDNCPAVANADQSVVPDPTKCMIDPSADTDGDTIKDTVDNCPAVKNTNQVDVDKDLRGDACDNCPRTANYSQKDADKDGFGDACEVVPDRDGDGKPDASDNCIALANADQADTDNDKVGNACDNCPTVANSGQQDADNNKKGDACDTTELPPANTCAEATTQTSPVKPNLYFLLDRSDSMGRSAGAGLGSRISVLKSGLNNLFGTDAAPGSVVRNFQVGMGAFPRDWGCTEGNLPEPLLDTGTRTASQLRAAYADMQQIGWTPTDLALRRVRTQMLYNLAGDTLTSRPKAVVLITDGSPNRCLADDDSRVTQTVAEAGQLAKLRIPVYVLGFAGIEKDAIMAAIAFAGNPANAAMVPNEACSQSGQTNCICASGNGCTRYDSMVGTWYEVSSSESITNALSSIISRSVSCSLPVTPAAGRTVDPAIARVRFVNGATNQLLTRGTDYNITGNTVTLLGGACTNLQNAVASNPNARVEVDLGCACVAGTEVCGNNKDDDCDGSVDEGCLPPVDACATNDTRPECKPTDKPAEVCNMVDDDGDGEIDADCPPACTPMLEICNMKDDDCDQLVDEGCETACTPFTEICDMLDNDCDGMIDEGCISCPDYANEICDFKDNDCDGVADDGCPGAVI